MTLKVGVQYPQPGGPRNVGRGLLTVVAVIWTVIVFLIVTGALFPRLLVLGVIGTLLELFFSLHLVLVGLAGLALALLARRRSLSRAGSVAVVCGLFATLGAIVPLIVS
jgi:hypothetical protein